MARRFSHPEGSFAAPGRFGLLRQRGLGWGVGLALVALVTGYVALISLAHAWPGVFPGERLALGVVDELPGPVAMQPAPDSGFNEPITLLVIGLDKRPLQLDLGSVNADTLMYASIDPSSHSVSVLGVPRDLLIDIQLPDGRTYRDRVNVSFAVGAQDGRYESGARQLVNDFENNFNVSVDHWVVLDFAGVKAFIDRVGGVEVDVPPDLAVPEWYYSDDDVVGHWVSFPAGRQSMDGYHAVAFGRARLFDDDFHRVRRQQLILTALLESTVSRGILNNPMSLWRDFRTMFISDVPAGRIPGYAALLRKAGNNVHTYSLADPVAGQPTVFDYWTPGGAEVLRWDADNVAYWFDVVTGRNSELGSSQ